MSRFKPIHLVAITLGISSALTCVAWSAEDTDVLPKGIYRARVVGIYTETIQDRYNGNGELQGLANNLNRSVTVNDFMQSKPELVQLINALNTLQPGLGAQLGGANLYANSELQVTSYMPALEYGVTKNITLGLRAPIVKRSSRNSFDVAGVNNASAISQALGTLPNAALGSGMDQFGNSTMDTRMFAQTIFTDKGYDAPKDFTKTELGDVEAGAKWNFFRNNRFSSATQLGMRFPTGSTPSLTNVFDLGSGGGSYALGLAYFQEYFATHWLTFGMMAKGLNYFADTRERAVPRNASDSLPSVRPQDGQVQMTTRSPGIELQSEISSTIQLFEKKWSFWTAYQHAQKGKDSYEGPGALYYDGLSANTNWVRRNLEIGTSLYTVPWFRKKEFPVPGRINLIYNTTLSGVNTALVSYIRTDLIVFF